MRKNVNSKQIKATSYFPVWAEFRWFQGFWNRLLVGKYEASSREGVEKDDSMLTINQVFLS